MADPRDVVPYHDPHNIPVDPSIFASVNPTVADLFTSNAPGPRTTMNEEAGATQGNPHQGQRAANVNTHSQWRRQPVRFNCTSSCKVIREVIHSNEVESVKLEIHGRTGMMYHAIVHSAVDMNHSSSSRVQYQMIDFSTRNIDEVKDFLVEYCRQKTSEGYTISQDPQSRFYEALCVGMNWTRDDRDDFLANDYHNEVEMEVDNTRQRSARSLQRWRRVRVLHCATQRWRRVLESTRQRSARSLQRRRRSNIQIDNIASFLHLPIREAARRLNISAPTLRSVCHQNGILQWPAKEIRKNRERISELRQELESGDAETVARVQEEIRQCEQQIRDSCGGRNPTAV